MREVPHELNRIEDFQLYSNSESDKECRCASSRHTEMYTKKELVQLAQINEEGHYGARPKY